MRVSRTTQSYDRNLAYIPRDTSQENHGYHDTEEHHNDQRVDQTEPVYTWVKDVKVVVPACGLQFNSISYDPRVPEYV